MEEKDEAQIGEKKPIYKKKGVIVLIIIIAIFCIIPIYGFIKNATKGQNIELSKLQLGGYLPDLPSNRGEINFNTDDNLQITLYNVSQEQYNEYKKKCENHGFNIDVSSNSSFEGYNEESYRLSMYDYDNELYLGISAPRELSTITWPTSEIAASLPVPKSNKGYINTEKANDFNITIGNMTKEEYDAYVNECSAKGYNIDYDKAAKRYKAKNDKGYQLEVSYEGGKRVNIHVKSQANDSTSTPSTAAPTTPTQTPEPEPAPTEAPSNSGGISKEFKDAMDSYEAFMNEYVEFMKKYKANSSDITLIGQYATMVQKYSDQVAAFEKWESEDLTSEELAYYIDVQARVSKKLLEV